MRVMLSIVLLVSLPACVDSTLFNGGGSKSAAKTAADPTAPVCPDAHAKCIGEEECVYDETKQCRVCHCAAPFAPTPAVGGVPPIQ